jgi:DMSO/TMAO reductase YedYZ molybdopterin-dependent catalytic subunit
VAATSAEPLGQVGRVGRVGKTQTCSPLDPPCRPAGRDLSTLPAPPALPALSRRDFLAAALLAPAAFARQAQSGARFISLVALGNPGGLQTPPFGRLLGSGLDARLFTDLSQLSADNPASLVTPNDRFFVRTAVPSALARTAPWTIRVGGLVEAPVDVALAALEPLARPGGRYLIECSGNADQTNYGLMSAADWEGVPLGAVLDRVRPETSSYRVLISGVDDETARPVTSVPGASWIFSRDDLQRALLAVRMNGAPLPSDHGFPVRLVVPGWYGCACIKWVDRIELVADEAPATRQMREFAGRTHQPSGTGLSAAGSAPAQARDFIPAVIDTAAMPVRVEKWAIDGRLAYRIAGIIWGGAVPTNALSIRFRSGQPWAKVDNVPLPASALTWSPWTHTWRPEAPGRYQIVLRVDDPTIRTRRLDIFFYVREIQIDEV